MIRRAVDPESIRYCDCAVCGRELLGESLENVQLAMSHFGPDHLPGRVAGRVWGRPLCHACLEPHAPPPGRATADDGPGPWYENARRAAEE